MKPDERGGGRSLDDQLRNGSGTGKIVGFTEGEEKEGEGRKGKVGGK